MSDKAKIYLKNEEWKVKNLFKDFSYEKMADILQSYADQCLKEILEEYQHYIDWNEEHDRNSSKQEKIDSFLNHLKQKQKGRKAASILIFQLNMPGPITEPE